MKTLPSAEFRKTYASLKEPVVVTVKGHPIGYWTPVGPLDEVHIWPDGKAIDKILADAKKKHPKAFPTPGERVLFTADQMKTIEKATLRDATELHQPPMSSRGARQAQVDAWLKGSAKP